MTWTCDQVEAQLSDYLEGLLQTPERAAFEEHVQQCAECAPLVASVRTLISELQEMGEVEAPPHLVYSILDKTLGPREHVTGWQAFLNFIRGFATAKFAYGVASVMATLLILFGASGISLRKPKLADMSPANVSRNIDRRLHLGYASTVKYLSDMRVVYEIQSRLRQGDNEQLQVVPDENVPQTTPEKPGKGDDHTHVQPKQQNRANQIGRQMELLAAECPAVWERSFR
jgi:Putative zinc-finger